jgi:hypothetical protein
MDGISGIYGNITGNDVRDQFYKYSGTFDVGHGTDRPSQMIQFIVYNGRQDFLCRVRITVLCARFSTPFSFQMMLFYSWVSSKKKSTPKGARAHVIRIRYGHPCQVGDPVSSPDDFRLSGYFSDVNFLGFDFVFGGSSGKDVPMAAKTLVNGKSCAHL